MAEKSKEEADKKETPSFLRALTDVILDRKEEPSASVQKKETETKKVSDTVIDIAENVEDIKKTNTQIANALTETVKQTKKPKPVEVKIPQASSTQTAALLQAPKAKAEELPPVPQAQPGEKPPSVLSSALDIATNIPSRTPTPTPAPIGAPGLLSRAASAAARASTVALPFMLLAEGTRRQREQIEANPSAPGLEFNPYAQQLRGEAKTAGEAGRRNRDRAVGQIFSNTIQAAIDSDLSDEELYTQYGRNRKELKEWVAKSKPGEPYDKPTSAPAVASREAEKIIPVETPNLPAPTEVAETPPITGMESAFVPTAPEQPPTPTVAAGAANVRNQSAIAAAEARGGGAQVPVTRGAAGAMAAGRVPDASKSQQAAVETGPLMSGTQIQIQERKNEIQASAKKVRDTAESLGLNPNEVTGNFVAGKLVSLKTKDGKEIDVTDRLSDDEKKQVEMAKKLRDQMRGTPSQPANVEPQSQVQKPDQVDSGPVSGTERAIMQSQGLDPEDPFDRTLYRRRSQTELRRAQQTMQQQGYAPVDEKGRVVGPDLNQMSIANNDLQRQNNTQAAPPVVIQNNNNAATQTTVTPPAQPRVGSSFSRVMDGRAAY